MTSLPGFPFSAQEPALPAGLPMMAVASGTDSAPLAEGETPAAFACVLQFCTEPAPLVRPVPQLRDGIVSAEPPPAVSARSLRLDAPEAAPENEVEIDDAPLTDLFSFAGESEPAVEVTAEILSRGVCAPVSMPVMAPPDAEYSVVEKQLRAPVSSGADVPVPKAPPSSAPAPEAPFVAGHSTVPAPAPDVAESTRPVPVERFVAVAAPVAIAKSQVENASGATLEKIAAPARRVGDRPADILASSSKNKFLNSDNQTDMATNSPRGIVNAKSAADMPSIPESTSLPAAPTQSRPVAATPVAEVVNATAPIISGVAPLTATMTTNPDVSLRREISLPTADAAAVVREVAELTHDFRFHERGSVEVKFNFKDDTELSVRLAYRDGDVHATFRTDSPELRTTLGREWQGYATQLAQEPRAYRMADPVFTNTNDFSGSPQGRDSGSATGGDARQQQQAFSNPDQSGGSHRSASAAHGFRQPASASSAAAPAPRVSTDRLLHAFA